MAICLYHPSSPSSLTASVDAREGAAAENRRERLHALVADAIPREVQLMQLRSASQGPCEGLHRGTAEEARR